MKSQLQRPMKSQLRTVVTLGLLLGILALVSCGQQQPQKESLGPTAAPTTDEATATDPATTTPSESATSVAETETAKPKADASAKAIPINPPQAATLKAQDADAQINLRSRPTADSVSKGYGLVGDAVKLTQAAEVADDFTWYHVKFAESGAEGWIRGDFINNANVPTDTESTIAVSVDSYTRDELLAVGADIVCGMSLKRSGTTDEFIFFNGPETTSMWMKLDGTMTLFRKTSALGEEFYTQTTTQSFVSLDGSTQVEVNVTPGTQWEDPGMDIEGGQLRLESGGEVLTLPVEGEAGCG